MCTMSVRPRSSGYFALSSSSLSNRDSEVDVGAGQKALTKFKVHIDFIS